jgi:carbon-monoxide dehydrogenase large subunit
VSILGTRVLRTEDPKFLTTGGVYTEDVVDERLAGAAHVFFVRSPVAHARIRGIDVSAALQAPGVVAAFTAADIADLSLARPMPMMNKGMARSLLASDKVRYVGDPVAIVVTEQPYQGEDATELVEVDYEILPAVIDLADALSGRVLLYEEAGTNVAATFGDASHLADDHEPAGGARPDGNPRCRGRLGRGRTADRVDPEPGSAGHQSLAVPDARRAG